MTFNNGENLIFLNPSFIIVNLPTHICPMTNWQLFFILTHWSYSKCKNMLQTLYVYKIPAKEHQVAHHWGADEMSVSQILFKKI